MILLDTCILLRITDGAELPPLVRQALERERWVVSAISAWEIGIKHALGKLPLDDAPSRWWPAVLTALDLVVEPFTDRQGLVAAALPLIHQDPFDRGLIATAIDRGFAVATVDRVFARYGEVHGLRLIQA